MTENPVRSGAYAIWIWIPRANGTHADPPTLIIVKARQLRIMDRIEPDGLGEVGEALGGLARFVAPRTGPGAGDGRA